MGVFVFLPLVLPLTAWPIARLAQQRLHPRSATRLLTLVGVVLALCSTLCLALIMVVGTAQLPATHCPTAGRTPRSARRCPTTGWWAAASRRSSPSGRLNGARHCGCGGRPARTSRHARLAVLPDAPLRVRAARRAGRIVVSTAMLAAWNPGSAGVFAHERAHLAAATTAICWPPSSPHAPTRSCGRCGRPSPSGRSAGRTRRPPGVGDRRPWPARWARPPCLPCRSRADTGRIRRTRSGAAPGQGAAGPGPDRPGWPPAHTAVGLAVWTAAAGATASALSSANATVALFLVLHAATPL